MTPLAAYADRLSVTPGETIRFHGQGPADGSLAARVVRVKCADPNPELGGVAVKPVAAADLRVVPDALRPRSVPLGSYAVIEAAPILTRLTDVAVAVLVNISRLPDKANALAPILSWQSPDGESGLLLGVDGRGRIVARCDGAQLVGARCSVGTWSTLVVNYDATARKLSLTVANGSGEPSRIEASDITHTVPSDATVQIAGRSSPDDDVAFNGRIERPALYGSVLSHNAFAQLILGALPDGFIAAWDFSREIASDTIIDIGPHGCDGRLINTPSRAVRGAKWDGTEMVWRHAPNHYAAIHFHDDDIDDCNWPVIAELNVPDDLPSAQYAILFEAGGATENVPFWVVPKRGQPSAKLAVLISTFTYTVYGNHARPEWTMMPAWQDAWRTQTREWNAYPHNPGDHHDMGLSTYNTHTDGTGISIASWHRPMLNLRLGYLTYPGPDIRASGLRHYPTDTHLTQWLDGKGIAYDIITDWELHTEGMDRLSDYRGVLTGTHPEYHTREMLDALAAFRDGGGRLAYLGGNGFYWKIALSPTKDGVVEIRRAEGGIRAWAAEPGEYYNQFDGEYGGLWRRNGRPPQDLVGVGFSAQGNFVGSHYRLTPDARDSRAAWIFDGVSGETIGGHGFSGHGAAGFELDRADKDLGTPAHAIVLAQSEDHPPDAPWVLVPEERLTHLTTIPGAPDDELIRADMTFFETAGGKGAVFSTGSITYCGSLPTNAFDNDISRVTENVVRRFLDPQPFAMPETERDTN